MNEPVNLSINKLIVCSSFVEMDLKFVAFCREIKEVMGIQALTVNQE